MRPPAPGGPGPLSLPAHPRAGAGAHLRSLVPPSFVDLHGGYGTPSRAGSHGSRILGTADRRGSAVRRGGRPLAARRCAATLLLLAAALAPAGCGKQTPLDPHSGPAREIADLWWW